jgi:transglutaminase superfamily protein
MSLSTMESQPRATRLLRVALAGALAGLAAWSFRTAFADGSSAVLLLAITVPTVVAVGWGCLVVTLGQRMNGAGGTVLAVLSIAVAVALSTNPGGDVRLGPARLLTGTLPSDPDGPQLATVSAVAGFAALIAVRFALRPRGALLPVLPALCCLLLGLGLGAAVAPLPGWYPVVFAVAVMVLVLTGRGNSRGRLVLGAMVMLFAATAGAVVGPLVSVGHRPATLQALVNAPLAPREQTNPMAQYLALRDGILPLEITGTGSEHVDRIRMVTLNDFDGRAWSVSADYRRAGTQFAGAARGTAGDREIALDLQVQTPASIGWLPRAGRPSRISVADLGFDAATGDIVVPAGKSTPPAYQVVGVEPTIDAGQLRADDPVAGATTLTARLPQDVVDFIGTATAGHSAGLAKFVALYKAMTDAPFRYDVSADARGGHGSRQISELLQRKRGTSEQYASAFAAMSRHLGWDARVVLGFRPSWDGDRLRIAGKDVYAWVEVRFQRLGWVPVDPSPLQTIDDQGRAGAQPPQKNDPVLNVLPPDQPPPRESDNTSPPPGPAVSPSSDSSVSHAGVVIAAVGVGLLLCVAAVPLAKIIRRTRARRVGTPRRRAVAAWQDAIESLRAVGIAIDRRATTGQVLGATRGSLWAAVQPLAGVVDSAAFAPEGILSDGADFAWRCSDAVRDELRHAATFGRRVRALFDPRPLLPARRSRDY